MALNTPAAPQSRYASTRSGWVADASPLSPQSVDRARLQAHRVGYWMVRMFMLALVAALAEGLHVVLLRMIRRFHGHF